MPAHEYVIVVVARRRPLLEIHFGPSIIQSVVVSAHLSVIVPSVARLCGVDVQDLSTLARIAVRALTTLPLVERAQSAAALCPFFEEEIGDAEHGRSSGRPIAVGGQALIVSLTQKREVWIGAAARERLIFAVLAGVVAEVMTTAEFLSHHVVFYRLPTIFLLHVGVHGAFTLTLTVIVVVAPPHVPV